MQKDPAQQCVKHKEVDVTLTSGRDLVHVTEQHTLWVFMRVRYVIMCVRMHVPMHLRTHVRTYVRKDNAYKA